VFRNAPCCQNETSASPRLRQPPQKVSWRSLVTALQAARFVARLSRRAHWLIRNNRLPAPRLRMLSRIIRLVPERFNQKLRKWDAAGLENRDPGIIPGRSVFYPFISTSWAVPSVAS
jgi:hypothetical protein